MLLICLARTRASGGETFALASLPSHMPRGQWLTRRCARTGATWEFWRTDLPRGQPGRLWPLRPWARRLSARRPRPWRATALVRAHASDVAGKPPAMRRRTAASNRATVRRRSEQASLMNGCNEAQIRAAAAGRVEPLADTTVVNWLVTTPTQTGPTPIGRVATRCGLSRPSAVGQNTWRSPALQSRTCCNQTFIGYANLKGCASP
jgi:hypothetical protein